MKYAIGILSLLLLFNSACTRHNRNSTAPLQAESKPDKLEKFLPELTVNFQKLIAGSTDVPSTEVTITDKASFKGATKRYQAYSFAALLKKVPFVDMMAGKGYIIEFLCQDGYKPTMSLDDALAANGYVAISDLDAAAPNKWLPILGKEPQTPGDYYLIWQNMDYDNKAYPWPYQLTGLIIHHPKPKP